MYSNKKSIAFVSLILLVIIFYTTNMIKSSRNDREEYKEFLTQESQKFIKNNGKEIVDLDHPNLAALQDYILTLDPVLKRVPRERLKDAYRKTMDLKDNKNSSEKGLTVWEEIPADLGGRTRALMFDPNDPMGKKVWAGSVTGGLWYNEDITEANSSWTPVNDFWADLSISCITYDPNDTQTIYVGTGEAETALITYRSSSGLGMGILKSTDGGNTWGFLSSTEGFSYVTDIQVKDEGGQSVIYAGVASGKYMGEQHLSDPTDGLYRSVDGGISWDQVLPDIPSFNVPYTPSDIEIGSDGRIYVGTMPNIDEEGAATILYSDIGLLGSWTVFEDYKTIIENEPTQNMPGRVILKCAPSDENIVYAEIASGLYQWGLPEFRCYHLIRSDDRGGTWNTLNTPAGNWATIAWHALAMEVDPNDPNTVVVGGLDVHKSTDGGNTWTKISDWLAMYSGGGDDYVHGDIHTIIYKQTSSQEVIISTDGGVFYTADITPSNPVFEERNVSYNTLQCYAAAMSPEANEVKYLSGHQDNCTVLWQGDPVTVDDMISGGDGSYCFFDKDEPNFWISSYQNNRYFLFVDGVQIAHITQYAGGNFISSTDYDYKQNILYANHAFFWTYNLDQILRLSGLPNSPSGEFLTLPTGGSTFTHVKYSNYSPVGTSTLFLGTQVGKMFKVENADMTPITTEIGSPNFPTAAISCIAIGESEDNLLVTFSNYGVSSVWQTTDGGVNWEEKEANLPDMPIRWALYNPDDDSLALLATEMGVWSTNNINETNVYWEPVIDGLANVRVDMLQLRDSDNTVLAATHGRGLFTANYFCPASVNENQGIDFKVYPNPTQDFVSIHLSAFGNQNVEILIFDVNGKEIYRKSEYVEQNNFTKRINLSELKEGVYFFNIKNMSYSKTVKIVKQ